MFIFAEFDDLFASVRKKYFTDIRETFFYFMKIFAVNTYKILANHCPFVVFTCPPFVDIGTINAE